MTKREKYMSITKITNISANNCSQVKKQSFSKTSENIQNGYLTGDNTQASLNKVPYISYLKQINLNNNISFKSSPISNYIKSYLNKNVIGYDEEKDKIINILLGPFLESYRNSSVEVPASVLLYGPEKEIMETFSRNISYMLDDLDNVKIIDFSDLPEDQFMPVLLRGLKQAKEYNQKTGRRSIFYLSNPEKFLSMTENQAKRLVKFPYNDEDINILRSGNKNIDNVAYFKSLLDICSKSAECGGYGLTFLLSTNSPHLLHPDLRKGKMDKIEIPRLKDKKVGINLFYILYNYTNNLINLLKDNPDNSKIIEKIKNLELDKFDTEKGALFVQFCCENPELGALSYKDLSDIVYDTCHKIMYEDNNEPEMAIFAKELAYKKRTFSPKDVVRQNQISNIISNKSNLYEQLKDKSDMGVLTLDEENLLKTMEQERKIDIATLEEKTNLNEFEKEYLRQLKESN